MNNELNKPSTVFIDKEYLDLVPRPTPIQYEELKQSVKTQGLLNPITVSKDGKVLDGHTRFQICSELNIIPEYEVKIFKNINDERLYVLTSNLRRRQLTPFQMFELVEKESIYLKKECNENRKKLLSEVKLGNREKLTRKEQLENSTDYKMGKLIDLSGSTVSRMSYIKRYATKPELEQIRSGKIGTDTIFRKIVKRRHDKGKYSRSIGITILKCPDCKKTLRKRHRCHVHKKLCCTNCEYGE